MAKQMSPLPDAKSVRVNPSAEELKELSRSVEVSHPMTVLGNFVEQHAR